MRILQLIDSLDAGGAERMAVNYANALSSRIPFSALIATRKEGVLKETIDKKVSYLFLNRKKTIDLSSVFRLKSFIKINEISIIHAHSTSLFTAVLVKVIYPKIKIIWHDHYGNSEYLESRPSLYLKIMTYFVSGVISVNHTLKEWAIINLKVEYVTYLPNFSPSFYNEQKATKIKGIRGKRIVCLANLRKQKNHCLLLEVAIDIRKSHPEWSFHLVGKNFNDLYSEKLQKIIKDYNLEGYVSLYDSCPDTTSILRQMDIGILTSSSEGLPLALIEYGTNNLACVLTAVGEVPKIINNGIDGFVVPHDDKNLFVEQLHQLIDSDDLRKTFGSNLASKVKEEFSQDAILIQYLEWINLQ